MSNISALLNPEPSSQKPAPSRTLSTDSNDSNPIATTFEAADALTTLATVGSNPLYAGAQDHYPPAPFSDARRQSSISLIAPVEPSPPIEHAQVHSPTLDHYHHASKSPEERRRPSVVSRTSSSNVLAPINSLSSILNEQVKEEPAQASPSFGKDVSQIVLPRSSEDSEERVVDGTQYREPGFVRDNPTTAQIREPSFGVQNSPHPISTAVPLTSDLQDSQPSPLPTIKPEPNGTPREGTPHSAAVERRGSAVDASMDTETLKAIEAVKQRELGLRAKSRDTVTPTADVKPATAPSKKRPAPKSATATKKGMASKKPAPKKRKLDPETSSVGDTPSVRRSETPSSRTSKPLSNLAKSQARINSQAGTPVGSSPAPDRSSQAPVSDVEDSDGTNEDDDAIFCICRKPDNHRWMIACDGGCEDWFHGSCVDMRQEDENLIDKYICPACEAPGKFTTWKPMCRRDGCRQPARLIKGAVSKYCSDECGVLFFKQTVGRHNKRKSESGIVTKRTRRKTNKDADGDANIDDDEEEPSPLGGVLRTRDLKALANASEDIESFRKLGSGVLSPPATASPTKATFSDSPKLVNGVNHAEINGVTPAPPSIPLNRAETEHLSALNVEKTGLQARLSLLKDREKFVSLAREQAARYAEREGLKPKEVCGYDSRLAWSESEFAAWRASKIGKASLKHNTLEPSDDDVATEVGAEEESHADKEIGDGADSSNLCTKKRCARHAQWQKINLQDARLEEVEVFESIKRVEQEEKEVRERAMLRARADAAAKKIDAVHGRRAEGWVERVGA